MIFIVLIGLLLLAGIAGYLVELRKLKRDERVLETNIKYQRALIEEAKRRSKQDREVALSLANRVGSWLSAVRDSREDDIPEKVIMIEESDSEVSRKRANRRGGRRGVCYGA